MSKKALFYLIFSFFSYIGDVILLYSLPTGLGLHKNDLSFTVLLFLIPATAIFISTFLNKKLTTRIERSNTDYGLMLFFIAGIEIIISILCINFFDSSYLVPLILLFIFLYAFVKEGIPRLLYVVAIYRYFCSDEEYKKIAGIDYALKILASFFGIFISSLLIKENLWIYSLLVDSLSFLPLAIFLILFSKASFPSIKPPSEQEVKETERILSKIKKIVPLMSLGSCLFWPHLVLLSGKLNVAVPWKATILIGLMALPGLISGLFLPKISQWIDPKKIVFSLPIFYICSGLIFLTYPTLVTLSGVMLLNGFIAGVYWPLDYSFRNKLGSIDLIMLNTNITRRFSVAQAASCCVVVLLSSHVNFVDILQVLLLTIACAYGVLIFKKEKNEKELN